MFALATIQLPEPVALYIAPMRSRAVTGGPVPRTGEPRTFAALSACFRVNPVTKTIHAELPPLPRAIQIYGPEDFAAACADTPDQHAERVLQILGSDPAQVLQAICDGAELPPVPVRVPRSIRAWQARELLRWKGLLAQVQDFVANCGNTAVIEAWEARENLARRGKTVLAVAAILGMDDEEVDGFFIEASKIEV